MKSLSLRTVQRMLPLLAQQMQKTKRGYILTENNQKIAVLLPADDTELLEEYEDLIWASRAEKIMDTKPALYSYEAVRAELKLNENLPHRHHRARKKTVKKAAPIRRPAAR